MLASSVCLACNAKINALPNTNKKHVIGVAPKNAHPLTNTNKKVFCAPANDMCQ